MKLLVIALTLLAGTAQAQSLSEFNSARCAGAFTAYGELLASSGNINGASDAAFLTQIARKQAKQEFKLYGTDYLESEYQKGIKEFNEVKTYVDTDPRKKYQINHFNKCLAKFGYVGKN